MKTYGGVEVGGTLSGVVPDDDVEDGSCRRRCLEVGVGPEGALEPGFRVTSWV